MSKIINEPKHHFSVLQSIRGTLEHRAQWLYLLCDEAYQKDLHPVDFAYDATHRCGCFQGKDLVKKGGTNSLQGLKKTLFTKPAQLVFEMKVLNCDNDHLDIDFHYCPLVKAWQDMGCDDEQIALLCDIAMEGDRGIAQAYGCTMEIGKTIAKGDGMCEIRFKRK